MTGSSKVARNRARRKAEIVARAKTYFARVGLDGTTRGLAKELECSPAMFYRYFPDTSDLIQAVFDATFDPAKYDRLPKISSDSKVPLKKQLEDVLVAYCQEVMDDEWIRLLFFASLSGYIEPFQDNKRAVAKSILLPICELVRQHAGLKGLDEVPVYDFELEMAWRPFGGVIYNMIRVHIFKVPLRLPLEQIIAEAVDQHLEGWYKRWPRHTRLGVEARSSCA